MKVKDLITHLETFKQDSKVQACFHDHVFDLETKELPRLISSSRNWVLEPHETKEDTTVIIQCDM